MSLQLQRRQIPSLTSWYSANCFSVCVLPMMSSVGADAAVRRQRGRLGRRDDAGQRLEPRQQRLKNRCFAAAVCAGSARERQPRDEDVLRVEPEVASLELDEVRIISPAPASSTSDSASSTTTKAFRSRPRRKPPPTPLPAVLSGSTMSRLAVCRAGARPKSSAVTIAIGRLNASAGRSSAISASRGMSRPESSGPAP